MPDLPERPGRRAWGPTVAIVTIFLALAAALPLPAAAQGARQSAVIVNYQRFGEDRYPDTSIRAQQFKAHIEELASGRYTVRPVHEIVETLFSGGTLANRTVGITVDDAYRSFYQVAWPLLKSSGLPLTLFVATDPVDRNLPGFMSWDQIRELRDAGVTIGAHTASHPHLVELPEAEIRREIEKSLARFEAELGERPTLFTYPHGETSNAVRAVVAAFRISAAFGQHSGTVNPSLDKLFLPRFSFNENYGGMADFRKRVNALGLPVQNLVPADPYLTGTNPPTVAFTVAAAAGRIKKINCFYSQFDAGFVEASMRDTGDRRYELTFGAAFQPGPWRINCTIPTGGKRIRWFGMQFYTPAS